MPFFNYNRDIPFEDNNPSVDQPNMKTNTNSTDDLINVDHYSFEQSLGGLHKQVQMPLSGGSPGMLPPGLIANEGTLYTKTVPSAPTLPDETGLFYTPDASTDEYQLTRTVHAKIATFSTNPGWTFLPGGLLMQYGSVSVAIGPSGTDVTFPVQFSTAVYSIQVTPVSTSPFPDWGVTSVSTTKFTARTSAAKTYYWVAIGK